jgi:hypothetical protein
LPDPNDPDLLAIVAITDGESPKPEEEAMFSAITQRRSNRMAYDGRPLMADLQDKLVKAAQTYGVWFRILKTDEERRRLIELIERGDRAQMANPGFRRELAAWLRPSRPPAPDGIPGYALGLPLIASYLGPFFVRWFDMGKSQVMKDRRLTEGSPVVAVLGSDNDTPSDWLATGQALSAVLLTARSEGVWGAFMNQPVEVAELRPHLAELIRGLPQIVLRMGYGPDVPPTPRRDGSRVLV